jgi:hypothetical protein
LNFTYGVVLLLIPLDATKVLNFTYGVVLLLIPLDATKVLNFNLREHAGEQKYASPLRIHMNPHRKRRPLLMMFFFFWPFRCLSFFDLQLLITALVSSNFSYADGIKYTTCPYDGT